MSFDHDAIVRDWKENAQEHDAENYRFLRHMKMRSAKKVDRIALQLHQEVFEAVDCTQCANCCRTLRPMFAEEDIRRIAAQRGMSKEEFIATFLEWDVAESRYRTKAAPCPLLGEDNRCTVYDVRPETCRGYPFTDKEDFASRSMSHAGNALVCPAVFRIVEEMKKRIR